MNFGAQPWPPNWYAREHERMRRRGELPPHLHSETPTPKETEMATPNINPWRGLSSTCTGDETRITRFDSCVAALVGNAAQMSELVGRLMHVADRLGGVPPAESAAGAGNPSPERVSVVEQLEAVIELHKSLTARAERTLERLEAL